MRNLTGFQRDLLYAIAGADTPKGVASKAELDEYYATEIDHGRLYPNLDAVIEEGLVEKGAIDDRTNSCSSTDRGRAVVRSRREWETEMAGERIEASTTS